MKRCEDRIASYILIEVNAEKKLFWRKEKAKRGNEVPFFGTGGVRNVYFQSRSSKVSTMIGGKVSHRVPPSRRT